MLQILFNEWRVGEKIIQIYKHYVPSDELSNEARHFPLEAPIGVKFFSTLDLALASVYPQEDDLENMVFTTPLGH